MLTQEILTLARKKTPCEIKIKTRSQKRRQLKRIYTSYPERERHALTDIHVLRSEQVNVVLSPTWQTMM